MKISIIRRGALALVPALAATAIIAGTTSTPARADGPIRVDVAGDSLTAFADSWRYQLTDPGIEVTGGFAQAGYLAGSVARNITEGDPDVLVIMLGTNDVRHCTPLAETEAAIEKIVTIDHPRHVLLSYLPPSDRRSSPYCGADPRTGNLVLSRALVSLGEAHGWLVADPFAPWRTISGNYQPGSTAVGDGIHPTAAVFGQIAQRMSLYIRQADLAGNGAAQ